MKFCKCFSYVSRHKQQRSSKHGPQGVFTAQGSPASCPSQRSLCAPQAQPITTSANQRYATKRYATTMKYFDCVPQYAVRQCVTGTDTTLGQDCGTESMLCQYVHRAKRSAVPWSCHRLRAWIAKAGISHTYDFDAQRRRG